MNPIALLTLISRLESAIEALEAENAKLKEALAEKADAVQE